MPRLTADQVKNITQKYFKECLKRLEFQFDTVDHYSGKMVKLGNSEDRLSALRALDHTEEINRKDFLLPNCRTSRLMAQI